MAQYEELTIDQGTDVAVELRLANTDGSAKNLAGFSGAAQMRRTISTSDSDAVAFAVSVTDPTTDGSLLLTLTNIQTDALTPGRYLYDVEISHQDSDSNTIIERVLEGIITVTPSVTRS